MLKIASIFILVFGFIVSAKDDKLFDATIRKYQNSKMISMNVEKLVKSELLSKETSYSGSIKLSKGKFRWENETPEKTLLLFDGEKLLNVQFPSKDFGGPIQVLKSKVDKKTKKQILISSLLSPSTTKTKFKVLSQKKNGSATEFLVQPDGEDLQVKDLLVKIDNKTKKIKQISYKDDVGNLTTLVFSEVKFLAKASAEAFKYKIPKKAQVTDL